MTEWSDLEPAVSVCRESKRAKDGCVTLVIAPKVWTYMCPSVVSSADDVNDDGDGDEEENKDDDHNDDDACNDDDENNIAKREEGEKVEEGGRNAALQSLLG